MSDALTSLEDIIQNGEPLSLAWVVEHGDAFQAAWKQSKNPRMMLWIACHVTLKQTAAASLAIARIMLFSIPSDIRDEFISAIDYAEIGEVSQAKRFANDAWGGFSPVYDSEADLAKNAILNAVSAAIGNNVPANAAGAARDAAKIFGEEQIAALVREHVWITIQDLVRAGKNGWSR